MSSKCIRDTVNKVKTKYQESDPYRLAAAMHIIVKKLPLGTDPNCCKGFCMRECRKTCIVINCDLPEIIQQIILIHEIGHALVAALEKHSQPVSKITIVPHTSGALGYTMQMPEEEKYLSTAEELRTELRTLVGGRAAEQVVFGVQTTGAANDIQRATALARNMVTQYGMSEKFGLMSTASVENQYLDGQAYMDCSQETAAEVDKEVMEILQKAYADAKRILTENRGLLDEISEFLLVKETITGDELMAYVNADKNALPAAEKTEE